MTSRETKKRLNKEKLIKLVDTLRTTISSIFTGENNTNLRFDIKDKEPQYKSDYLRYDFTLATYESSFSEKDDERIYSDLLGKNSTVADKFELDVIDPATRLLKDHVKSLGVKAFMTNSTTSMGGH